MFGSNALGWAYPAQGPSVNVPVPISDAQTAVVKLTPSGTELATFADAQNPSVVFTPSGTEIREYVDANTVNILTTSTDSGEVLASTDSLTLGLTMVASVVEGRESIEAAVVNVVLTGSGVEAAASIDSNAIGLIFTPSGIEQQIAGAANSDSAVVQIFFTPGVTEVGAFTEASVVRLGLPCTGSETLASVDSSASAVKLTPTSTDVYAPIDSGTAVLVGMAISSESVSFKDDAAVGFVTLATSAQEFAGLDDGQSTVHFFISAYEDRLYITATFPGITVGVVRVSQTGEVKYCDIENSTGVPISLHINMSDGSKIDRTTSKVYDTVYVQPGSTYVNFDQNGNAIVSGVDSWSVMVPA